MHFSSFPTSRKLKGALLAHSIKVGDTHFKKGRLLSPSDINKLLSSNIKTVMVALLDDNDINEDQAAKTISALIKGKNLEATPPFTGRVNLLANKNGLCLLNVNALQSLNRIDEAVTVATIPNYEIIHTKQMVATIKIIPFGVPRETIKKVEGLISSPLINIKPFKVKIVKHIQTFHEGTKQSVLDKTRDVLTNRLIALGNKLHSEQRCPHDISCLTEEITRTIKAEKPDVLILTGASAITDRADVLPQALKHAGGTVQRFGMPVDPGNLLMLGDIGDIKVIGMPGCARSPKLNGFDWVLQRMLAEVEISNNDISDMAVGGLLKEIPTRPLPRSSTANKKMSNRKEPIITAVILAAGQSRRMGKNNKLLMKINNTPMICHSTHILRNSDVEEIILVTGFEQEKIQTALSTQNVTFIHNSAYTEGISSSLKTGIANVSNKSDAALICLGDMPLITNEDVKSLIAAFNPTKGCAICVPTYKGKWGNPVLIAKQFFAEIQELSGDIGARYLISEYPDLVCEVEMQSDGVLSDFDDPKSFKRFD